MKSTSPAPSPPRPVIKEDSEKAYHSSKLRKLKGSPHVLFPVGREGGRLRQLKLWYVTQIIAH